MGDSKMGLHARLMSQALRKLTGTISKTNCTVFFINQLRENWGNVRKSWNNYWWKRKVYASVRLDIRRSTQIKDGDSVLGNRTKVKVVKNKVAPPSKLNLTLCTVKEFQNREILDLAVEFEIIKSRFLVQLWWNQIRQGRDAVKSLIKDNPELADELEVKIKARIKELADA
jgi:recombination protein RecA